MFTNRKAILIVGDGDLSFAASAALHVEEPKDLTASVWESEKAFMDKYDRGSN